MGLLVGVDIGNSGVKAVALQQTGDSYKLKSLISVDVRRPDFFPNEDPQNTVEAPRRALERVIKNRNFSRKTCACSASGSKVAARLFRFPKLAEKEIEAAVRFEAEQVIPFDLEQAALDYILFDDVVEDGVVKTEGLVVATHEEEVNKLLLLLKSVHLEPLVFDMDALAIANCYLETRKNINNRKVTAILNIGAQFTNLTILQGRNRVFVRDIAIGGDIVSRTISEIYGFDLATAEQRKRDLAFQPFDEDEQSDDDFDHALESAFPSDLSSTPESFDSLDLAAPSEQEDVDAEDMILIEEEDNGERTATDLPVVEPSHGQTAPTNESTWRVLDASFGELMNEVEDTFKYYVNKKIVPKVDEIILTGGSSKLPELQMYTQEVLRIPSRVWNPLEGIDCTAAAKNFPNNFLDEVGPYMGVALGLAMRST